MTARSTAVRFAVFAAVMVLLTGLLFIVFSRYRSGSTADYSAIFADASDLAPGDTVRAVGVRVGTVTGVTMRDDNTVTVTFDADDDIVVTTGSRVAVRYLNLVGDRYLEIVDAPGSTRLQPRDTPIPADRTQPALDLDLLLGGLKPVVQGLDPADVNTLTAAVIQILQGQGGTLSSLLAQTSSFTNTLADN